MPSSMLSIPEFCREFSISRSHVYTLLTSGDLKAVKIGRFTRIRREDAHKWIDKRKELKPWLPRKLRNKPA